MKNSLELRKIASGAIRTHFTFADGSTMWEIFRIGQSDHEILSKIFDKKVYQYYPGEWELTFTLDGKVIQDPSFAKVIQLALLYIYERDNPNEPEYFC